MQNKYKSAIMLNRKQSQVKLDKMQEKKWQITLLGIKMEMTRRI